MAILKAAKTEETLHNWKKYIIPAYVVVSFLFIIYSAFAFLQGYVYQSGIATGQQQGLSVGQEQGYTAAISELIGKISGKCDSMTLNVGDSKVEVVNVACLSSAPVPAPEASE